MKLFLFALVIILSSIAVKAAPLRVLNVGAPAINCVFTTASPCTISVSDTSDNVTLSAGGTGFLQSRTFKAWRGRPPAECTRMNIVSICETLSAR